MDTTIIIIDLDPAHFNHFLIYIVTTEKATRASIEEKEVIKYLEKSIEKPYIIYFMEPVKMYVELMDKIEATLL